MNFKEQYQHPYWQKKRLEILDRDEYRCLSCGDMDTQLHVHHKSYDKDCMIWEYDNKNFITLCSQCHKEIHDIKTEIKSVVDMGFTVPDTAKYLQKIVIYLAELYISDLDKVCEIIMNTKKTNV